MAKIKLIAPYSQFRGTVRGQAGDKAAVLYDSPRSGAVSRSYVVPTNPNTALQQTVRANFVTLAAGWQGLTQAQVDVYNAYAVGKTTVDALGNTIELTGENYYYITNSYRLLAGQAMATAPAQISTPAFAGQVITKFQQDAGGDYELTIAGTNSAASDSWIAIYANPVTSPGRLSRPNDMRMLSTYDSLQTFTPSFKHVTSEALSHVLLFTAVFDGEGVDVFPVGNVVDISAQLLDADFFPYYFTPRPITRLTVQAPA